LSPSRVSRNPDCVRKKREAKCATALLRGAAEKSHHRSGERELPMTRFLFASTFVGPSAASAQTAGSADARQLVPKVTLHADSAVAFRARV
jgi:hypothetical protein